VRISAFFFSLVLFFYPLPGLQAQDPGSRQDAEAAREKLLKAEDDLENIQANSEATKTSVDGMKNDVATLQATVTRLQNDNASLQLQLTQMQAAFDQYKEQQLKSRQKLIDDVAGLIAASKVTGKSGKKKTDADTDAATPAKPADSTPTPSNLAPPPDNSQPPSTASIDNTPPPPKPQKGYYHVVAPGETLTMICNAYKENGVNVTVAEVRKANGISENGGVKAGQKLFIPKPGT